MNTRGATLLLALVALTACESTEPELFSDDDLALDLAMVAADQALTDLGTMNATAGPFAAPGDGMPGERSRTVEFFDASGAPMDAFDPLLTASVRVVTEVSVERERENWSASLEAGRDFTVSGLEGEETERTWNGTSESEISRSSHANDRSYEMTSEGSVSDVVRAVDREAHPWPLSGTITRSIVVERETDEGVRTVERVVVIVFDGTQFPDMTVNGESFELDLGARDGRRPFRDRRNR